MFESLTQRLDSVFDRLRGKGKVTEKDVTDAMREVRQALLEADVNFKLVKQFVARVQERAVGAEVLESLSPAQQVIGIVHDELVTMLGGEDDGKGKIQFAGPPPTILMLVGLQGSGKTTQAGKLANYFRKQGQKPGMVAADMQRPAAVQQLQQLGRQLDIPVYAEPAGNKPIDITQRAVKWAREQAITVLILDTAGRLHIDEDLMQEVATIRQRTQPQEVLLVVDAMTGQDAVRVADEFNKTVGLTGLILTKMDGDARGGAALSVRQVTGVPIKFMGTGEKLDALGIRFWIIPAYTGITSWKVPYVKYFSNGKIASSGAYSQDLQTGPWKFFYESGKLKEEETFVGGKTEGLFSHYYENGQLQYSYTSKKGKADGV